MAKKILVVDDDPEFLMALSRELVLAGYEVIEARNATEAGAILGDSKDRFDAAIIDLSLPGVGGFQVIGELTKVQQSTLPVLAITGAYGDIYLEVAEYLGARASIRKPAVGQPPTPVIEAMQSLLSA